jgi:hypothetical protein
VRAYVGLPRPDRTGDPYTPEELNQTGHTAPNPCLPLLSPSYQACLTLTLLLELVLTPQYAYV